MVYTLTLEQIKDILKEGKFDENKYVEDLTLYSFTTGEVTDAYEDRLEEVLEKISYEELCKQIYEELKDTVSDYTDTEVADELYDGYFGIIDSYIDY